MKLFKGKSKIEKIVISELKKNVWQKLTQDRDTENYYAVRLKKYQWACNLIDSVLSNFKKGNIDRGLLNRLGTVILEGAFHMGNNKAIHSSSLYETEFGIKPPSFLVISPTNVCNLNCTGCYANCNSTTRKTIPYNVFDKLVGEFHDECNGRFIVISGGEPLCYRDEGKNLFDIIEKYNDIFFMFYTNGTLFTEEVVRRIKKVGNCVACISVEGYEAETDLRRGIGTHKKILETFRLLKNHGIPFTISVTATEKNKSILLDDKFYEYYFDKLGASFMWQFQFMPIGRGAEVFDLMPSPATRVQLFRFWERLLEEKKYCIADFWNSGMLSNGCVAYGRSGGYVYIDWNGKIAPCVFVPYYVDTIYEMYASGRKLGDALNHVFFKNGRKWQKEYGLDNKVCKHNGIMPCSIRDHFSNFKHNICTPGVKGSDEVAEHILKDKWYEKNMQEYDTELKKLTEDIWEDEYCGISALEPK